MGIAYSATASQIDIKIGNTTIIDFAVKDVNKILVTDLATATGVKYMIKENADDLDIAALVSKTLTAGIAVNSPSTGYIRVTILPADTTGDSVGQKYQGLQIEYSATNIIEPEIIYNNIITNKINILQDIVR